MIQIYCQGRHGTRNMCPDCLELFAHATERIDKCVFHEQKAVCSMCPIHCYKPVMRDRVRQIMRYAGPRMIAYHPILTILHYTDRLFASSKHNGL
jgi:hypothetical protein